MHIALYCIVLYCIALYICILHRYYIFDCFSGLQCWVSIAPVSGHYTWIAGMYHMHVCRVHSLVASFVHYREVYSSGYLGTIGRLGTRSQSWEKASGIGHPRAIQLHSFSISFHPILFHSLILDRFFPHSFHFLSAVNNWLDVRELLVK